MRDGSANQDTDSQREFSSKTATVEGDLGPLIRTPLPASNAKQRPAANHGSRTMTDTDLNRTARPILRQPTTTAFAGVRFSGGVPEFQKEWSA